MLMRRFSWVNVHNATVQYGMMTILLMLQYQTVYLTKVRLKALSVQAVYHTFSGVWPIYDFYRALTPSLVLSVVEG
jgi:hypothetical protein